MNEHVLFRWPDGTELVRFLDEETEREWMARVAKDVNDQIREAKSRRHPFEFTDDMERILFLLEPGGGTRWCSAAFSFLVDADGDLFLIDRIFPYHQVGAGPSVTRKTWGLWFLLRQIQELAARGFGPQGEGLFLGFGLPWLEPLQKVRDDEPQGRWMVTKWVHDKIRYDAADDYRSGTWGAVVNGAQRVRGNQKPPKTVRLRALPDWEISRRPRPWDLPGPTEFVWNATNFALDLTIVNEDDLEGVLLKAGIVFFREDGEWGRDVFVLRYADIPVVGQVEEIHLLLGTVPPTFTLSTKELREYVVEGSG